MNFPTPHTVGHHVHGDGGRDANGRAVSVYTPPLGQPGAPVQVIGWETPRSDEPDKPGHDQRVTVDVKLFAAPGFSPAPRDIVAVPGIGHCEVIGIPESTDGNPFGWVPGSTIHLRRVTG